MRTRLLTVLTAIVAVSGGWTPLAKAAAAPHHRLTRTQIRQAMRRAKHSRMLWATVNICNTRHHPHTVGIRGQMPALGFPARLSMDVQVDYWAGQQRGFIHDPGVHQVIRLGRPSHGLHQGGYKFEFRPPAILSGEITFEWRIGHRVIGRVTRRSAHGVRNVDYGDPPGYSAATCRILS